MAIGNPARDLRRRLIAHGLAASTPVAVIADGTRPTQRTVTGTLATIAGDVPRAELAAPAIVDRSARSSRCARELRWFDRMPLFGKRVLITRPARASARVRARALCARRRADPRVDDCDRAARRSRSAHRAIDELASYRVGRVHLAKRRRRVLRPPRRRSKPTRATSARPKVAAIGSKTAERLRAFGVRADLVPAAFVSEEIAAR